MSVVDLYPCVLLALIWCFKLQRMFYLSHFLASRGFVERCNRDRARSTAQRHALLPQPLVTPTVAGALPTWQDASLDRTFLVLIGCRYIVPSSLPDGRPPGRPAGGATVLAAPSLPHYATKRDAVHSFAPRQEANRPVSGLTRR